MEAWRHYLKEIFFAVVVSKVVHIVLLPAASNHAQCCALGGVLHVGLTVSYLTHEVSVSYAYVLGSIIAISGIAM